MKNLRKRQSRPKGQSLIEVAVSLMILLIMLAGMVDVGRLFIAYMSQQDAAQEGIAYGSVYPTFCNQIVQRIVESAPSMFASTASQVTILVDGVDCASATPSQACIGREITIIITDPAFQFTMPFIGTILGRQSIPLSTTVHDSILRPPCP